MDRGGGSEDEGAGWRGGRIPGVVVQGREAAEMAPKHPTQTGQQMEDKLRQEGEEGLK